MQINLKYKFYSVLLVIGSVLLFSGIAQASDEPVRVITIEVISTEHEWWLVYWKNDKVACELYIDHDQEPTPIEVFNQCGEEIYDDWMDSTPCLNPEDNEIDTCKGMYLHLGGQQEKTKSLEIELPTPRVWTRLINCTTVGDTELCEEIPSLLIKAEEPLPNETIKNIQGTINDIPFLCEGDACELPLRQTADKGMHIEFWAESTYGDSTQHYSGRIRVVKTKNELSSGGGWRIDIVSDSDDFNTLFGCDKIWQAFPPLGSLPVWLENPSHTRYLETDEPYTYLAGQLIFRGYVDTGDCENFGLLPNGYASQCGLERARDAVRFWQNTFDSYFIQASEDTGIPSQLLKRIYAKESQFWPETVEHSYHEYGPGHINELGADTALFWNRDFYDQFCPLILAESVCNMGYSQLDDWNKVLLRGAFLSKVKMDLPDLDLSVDTDQVNGSVSLFAETILGNCSQVNQIIMNHTGNVPGGIVSYEDLWRFTLVNYHAGSGCLSAVVDNVDDLDQNLSWENISRELESECPWAIDYVNGIIY